GGISLEGASVEVQGAKLNAQNDIQVVSTNGNIFIDGVKNQISNLSKNNLSSPYVQELDRIKNEELKLKTQDYKNDFEILKKSYGYYTDMVNKYWDPKTLDQSNNPNMVIWTNAYLKYKSDYEIFRQKYAVKVNYNLGEPPILKNIFDGSFFSADYVFSFKYDPSFIQEIERNKNFYLSGLNGYEHVESELKTLKGNVLITSSKG
ncbi:MAG: hypothetical protein ACK44H_10765, partial [Candidatus Kryptonium sp.]